MDMRDHVGDGPAWRPLAVAALALAALMAGCTQDAPAPTGPETAGDQEDATGTAGAAQAGTGAASTVASVATGSTTSGTSTTSVTATTTTSTRPWWDSDACRNLPSTAVWQDEPLFDELLENGSFHAAPPGLAYNGTGPGATQGAQLHAVRWEMFDDEDRRLATHSLYVPASDAGGQRLTVILDADRDADFRPLGHRFLANVTTLDEAGRDAVLDGMAREVLGDGRVRYDADGPDLALRLGLLIPELRAAGPPENRSWEQTVAEEWPDWRLSWKMPWVQAGFSDERGGITLRVTPPGHAEATVAGSDEGLRARLDAAFEEAGITARGFADGETEVGIRRVVC